MRRKNRYTEKRKQGIVTPYGQWKYPGEITTIPDNNITMHGVPYPVLGVSDAGDVKMMMPGMDYLFNGNEVTEYPMMQKAQSGLWNWIKETGRKVIDSEARKAPSYKSDISFKNAFDDAKNKGYKTFYWNGKYYNTKEKVEENEPVIKKDEFISTEPHKKIAYGTNEETRKRVYDRFPVLRETTDSIAKAYNISPSLLRTRLANEGFIDEIARDNDSNNGVSDFNAINLGFSNFGTDNIPYYIESGLVNPINEKWSKGIDVNENYKSVFPAQGDTWRDNIGLMAATLQGFRNKAIEDFPELSDDDYNRLANAYYNRGIKGGRDWWNTGGKGYNIIDYQTGGIHINPKNKGKFTAAAQRAGKSVQAYAAQILANKENYSPTLIKRANFARNAAKFKHQSGGIGKYLEGNYVQPQTVGNVMNSWNNMLAKGLSKGDNIANWVGTGLQVAATAAGSIASQWDAANGKQDWMNGKKKMSAQKYLTSPQFVQDLVKSAEDYEDTTEYEELPYEVKQYQQQFKPYYQKGGNTSNIINDEHGEVASSVDGDTIEKGPYHTNYTDSPEKNGAYRKVTNNAILDSLLNKNVKYISKRINPYKNARRIGRNFFFDSYGNIKNVPLYNEYSMKSATSGKENTFLYPATTTIGGKITEPRKGADYPLARYINNNILT